MSIKKILEGLVNHSIKKALGYAPNDYADKDIAKAHQAILAEFERMLPEEKQHCVASGKYEEAKMFGYNQAIQDIKAKLHIEKL